MDNQWERPSVLIAPEREDLLSEASKAIQRDRYLLPHEESCQHGLARAALAFSDSPEMAQRIYDYASKQWFMYATPVYSNAPERKHWADGEFDDWEGNFRDHVYMSRPRGMPISCFLNYVQDSREGITDHYTENAWLASLGGGVGGAWSNVRADGSTTSTGSKSTGVIPFMHVVDSEMLAFNQGTTRRGSYAAYLDISHPEIEEFIEMRNPTGGDPNRKCLNLHHAVNVTNEFMRIIDRASTDPTADTTWQLRCPNSHEVVKEVDAKALWERIIKARAETGEPFIHFIDTTNEALPQPQRELGLTVNSSNLCTEITLPTSEDRTAVCCLSSVNLEKWEEWKDEPQFIADLVRFLDNVIEYFITNAPDSMSKAVYSASRERSIGLGAMGFHALLQSKSMPIESAPAIGLNRTIFKHIKEQAHQASKALAEERGECPDMEGYGVRHAHLLAIAPNASSGILADSSPSIEPYRANVFVQKTLSGSFTIKNKFLKARLEELGINNAETWKSVLAERGSVQHLEELTDWDKLVFKTALEIDQQWLVTHAAHRQPHICQAQSLNLFYPHDAPIQSVHTDLLTAWRQGLKSLYYHRSEAAHRAEVVSSKVERQHLTGDSDCIACEG